MRKSLLLFAIAMLTAMPLRAQQEKKEATPPKDAAKPNTAAKGELSMTVVTKTGKVNKFAATNGLKVYIFYNGDPMHRVQLDNPRKNDLELGATDTFRNLRVDPPLEEIKTLVLAVEGHDMWKCESISFQFFQKGLQTRMYKFNPDRFLSGSNEKRKLNAVPFLEFKLSTKPVLAPPEKKEEPKEKSTPKEKK